MISNGSDRLLSQNPGTLPDVSGALFEWFQTITFIQIVKTIINFQSVETQVPTTFQGVWQPFTDQQLTLKPEGQRSWKWFMLHAQPSLILKPDDIVSYQGEKFRVMSKRDYKEYGYIEYHCIGDYVP